MQKKYRQTLKYSKSACMEIPVDHLILSWYTSNIDMCLGTQ